MTRTAPDWSSWGRVEALLQRYDDLEIAARLGGPQSPHREGMVLHQEYWANGITGWDYYGEGTGYATRLDATYARRGPVSFMLQPGNASGDIAWLEKGFLFPVAGKCGVDFAWSLNDLEAKVHLKVRHYLNNRIRRYGMRIDTYTGELDYLGSDNTWVAWYDSIWNYNGAGQWNIWKLIVDLDNNAYAGVWINGVLYSISTVQTHASGAIYPSVFSVEIQVEAIDSNQPALYVDDIVITDNERV